MAAETLTPTHAPGSEKEIAQKLAAKWAYPSRRWRGPRTPRKRTGPVMAEELKSQAWWQTLPGILTAAAAIITALAGLVVALHQAGLFSGAQEQVARINNPVAASPERPRASENPVAVSKETRLSVTEQATQYPMSLLAGAEVKLGKAIYKILEVQLDRHSMEQFSLQFMIRLTNTSAYDMNFWDASFRLLVDGVPRAPVSDLNKLVESRSADEGSVIFVIPNTTTDVVLQIFHHDETTQIPIDLRAVKP